MDKYLKSVINNFKINNNNLIIKGYLIHDKTDFKIMVDEIEVKPNILKVKDFKGLKKVYFELVLDLSKLFLDSRKMSFKVDGYLMTLNMNPKKSKNSYFRKWRFRIKNNNSLVSLTYNRDLGLVISLRPILPIDSFSQQVLLFLGFILGRLKINRKRIILFEKDCSQFEESAWVLYKYLIDHNYSNVYYSLSKSATGYQDIEDKYKKHIIHPHTLKQYYYVFSTLKYFGTEFPIQLINRDANNPLFKYHLNHQDCKCLMLGHGVQSLSNHATFRKGFYRKGKLLPMDSKTVLSSVKEVNDFVSTGDFTENDFLVSGLPTFDTSYRYDSADKILIMPTWRGWEHSIVAVNPEESGYYKFMMEIFNSVPEQLVEKVIVMPHPIMVRYFQQNQTSLNKYIRFDVKYDDLLKEAAILITDYSSISYDAFFRGTNVLFYFKEKDYCMSKYGGELILKDNEMFGDVSYNKEELKKDILKNYLKRQKTKYQEYFSEMVEFNDRQNTSRLVKLLKECNYLD